MILRLTLLEEIFRRRPRQARRVKRAGFLAFGTAVVIGFLGGGQVSGTPDQIRPSSKAATAADTVKAFDTLFSGPHRGLRAVHAKGVLVEGDFAPAGEAARISAAPHLQQSETHVLVRFSNFPGDAANADGDALSSPRGMAIKFSLADREETDIVAHSYNGFPASTPEKFLEFLQTVGANEPGKLDALAAREPAVRAFLDAEKPAPASYGSQVFFGVNAFAFTNAAGEVCFGRYRIEPVAGERYLSSTEAGARAPDYLRTDLSARLAEGPIRFRLMLQLAANGDDVADGSKPWPADRPVITLGTLSLKRLSGDQSRQRTILFTPLSLVKGIAASSDPLLGARTRTYRVSHERRTSQAPETPTTTTADAEADAR